MPSTITHPSWDETYLDFKRWKQLPLYNWKKICVSWESGHLGFSFEPAINRCVTLDKSGNTIFLILLRELDSVSSELPSMSSILKA